MIAIHTFLRRGSQLAGQGAWPEAGEALKEGQQAHPTEARLVLQRLRLLTEQGEFEEGATLAALLLERFPEHAPGALFAGKLYFAAKDFEQAAGAFTTCLKLMPGNLLARDYLALTHWVSQDRREALADLLKGKLSHNTDFLSDFAESAERFLIAQGLKNAPDAAEVDEGTPELSGEAPPPAKGEVPAESETANAELEPAPSATESPEAAAAEVEWPNGLRPRSLLTRLVQWPRRWRETSKRFGRAAKCSNQQDFAGALEEIDQLLKMAPDLLHAHTAQAEALYYDGRFAEAGRKLARLEEAAQRREYQKMMVETLPIIQSMRGYVLIRLGLFEEALAALIKVEPFGPDDFMGYYHRAIALHALGRWREAREQLRIAWGEYQNSTEYFGLTRLLTELKAIHNAGLDQDLGEQTPQQDLGQAE